MGDSKFVIAVVLIVVTSHVDAQAEWICWSANQDERIQCAQPDGSMQLELLGGLGKPMGMAVDQINGILYWGEREPERIMSLDLNGDGIPTELVSLGVNVDVRGVAVALSIGKIYWVTENNMKIQRANLDGTDVEDLPIAPATYFDVIVDDTTGTLYWTAGSEIWRGALDGTSASMIIGDNDQPYYFALDLAAGKIYWTDFGAFEIGRANLDGSEREIPGPITGLSSRPLGISLDSASGKVYWTLESGAVQRANLDGSGIETVLANLDSSWDVDILQSIPASALIPTVSSWGLVIFALALLTAGTILRRGSVDIRRQPR